MTGRHRGVWLQYRQLRDRSVLSQPMVRRVREGHECTPRDVRPPGGTDAKRSIQFRRGDATDRWRNSGKVLFHCVSERNAMSEDFAAEEASSLGTPTQPLPAVGRARLRRVGRDWVADLVTREDIYERPTAENFGSSLRDAYRQTHEAGITEVVMPRIGRGPSRLPWTEVRRVVEQCSEELGMTSVGQNKINQNKMCAKKSFSFGPQQIRCGSTSVRFGPAYHQKLYRHCQKTLQQMSCFCRAITAGQGLAVWADNAVI